MAKSKRSCYLCGTTYEYCDCNRQPAFMATFCSENCRDIFKTLSSYGVGIISAEECKELLDCCEINIESYKESTRNTIEKVYEVIKPIVEIPEIVEPIVEEIEKSPETKVDEPVIFERKRKRNHEVVLENIE